jgi:hypothetical protein
MADITAAIEQDQVATSLLSDSDQQALAAEYDPSLAGVIDRGEEEQEYGAEFEDQGDPEADDRDQVNWGLQAEKELYLQEQERLQQEQEGQEPQEQPQLSPQEIQEGIQQLDQDVQEMQLADPAETAILASSLGLDAANSAPLGHALAKVGMSVEDIWQKTGGDLTRAPAIPREAAVAFTNELLRSFGVDPRTETGVDPERLSATVFIGAYNLLNAVAQHGLNAGIEVLNSPEGSKWFAENFLQCIGGQGPVNLEGALRLADSCGRYFLSVWNRLDSHYQAQEQPARQSRASRSSGRSRFQSNADLFDEGP